MERYQRLDQDTLKLNFTIDEPEAYPQPWVGDTKSCSFVASRQGTDLRSFRASDEEDSFTNRIRMPAVPKPNN